MCHLYNSHKYLNKERMEFILIASTYQHQTLVLHWNNRTHLSHVTSAKHLKKSRPKAFLWNLAFPWMMHLLEWKKKTIHQDLSVHRVRRRLNRCSGLRGVHRGRGEDCGHGRAGAGTMAGTDVSRVSWLSSRFRMDGHVRPVCLVSLPHSAAARSPLAPTDAPFAQFIF